MPHEPRKISKPPEGKFGEKHQILSSIIGLVKSGPRFCRHSLTPVLSAIFKACQYIRSFANRLKGLIGFVIFLGEESITTNAEKRRGGKYDGPSQAAAKNCF